MIRPLISALFILVESIFMKNNIRFKGLLFGFIATLFWASSYIVGRFLFGEDGAKIDPVFLTFIRYLISSMLLTGVMVYQKKMLKRLLKLDLNKCVYNKSFSVVGRKLCIASKKGYTKTQTKI